MTSSFRIGGDREVWRLGFGAMHLPTGAGAARDSARAVLRRAVELGVTLIDTAYLYGAGANEELIAEALHPYPAGLLVTTKVGVARTGPPDEWSLDGRPPAIVEVAGVQNRYNLLDREHEPVLAVCERAGIAFLPWRPVAAGGSGARPAVAAVASEIGVTATQVALAWLLERSPVVLPIPGTARVDHLAENVAAARIRLTPEQMARLETTG